MTNFQKHNSRFSAARFIASQFIAPQFIAPKSIAMPNIVSKVLFLGLVVSLAGCAADMDSKTFGLADNDYRLRHPIVVSEQEQHLDLPVGHHNTKMTYATGQIIAGFVQNYKNSSAAQMLILHPTGSGNAGAAQRYANDVAAHLQKSGVPHQELAIATYDASGYGDQAPIRLVYSAIAASTGPCGQWPEDLVFRTEKNTNYYNFGCATQSNLAAQIANPTDLIAPRAVAPIDATRRTNAIATYRENGAGNL